MVAFLFFLIGFSLSWILYKYRIGSVYHQATLILQQAEKEADKALFEKKLFLEEECKTFSITRLQYENELKDQKKLLSQKESLLQKKEEELKISLKKMTYQQEELEKRIEDTALLTHDEAKKSILHEVEIALEKELSLLKEKNQKAFSLDLEHEAEEALFSTLERKSLQWTKESFIERIPISSDMIPKIIGKDGRNIQTLEQVLQTVCSIQEDNDPLLVLSSHDPEKRSLAKKTVQALLSKGKITPQLIQECFLEQKEAQDSELENDGKQALEKASLKDSFPKPFLKALGKLSLHTSFHQNTLLHSIEVSSIMDGLSNELLLSQSFAKQAGLFHDIGKALSEEYGKTHALAGATFLKKWGIHEEVVQAVLHHHDDHNHSPLTRLLAIADRLSATLPGVRNNPEPKYLELAKHLEALAKTHPLVTTAWAHFAETHMELILKGPSLTQKEILEIVKVLDGVSSNLPIRISVLSDKVFECWA